MEYAEQARLHAQEIYPEVKDIKDWGRVYHEKFAELIVRECVEICRSEDWEDQQGWGKLYAHNIRKHFGVEE